MMAATAYQQQHGIIKQAMKDINAKKRHGISVAAYGIIVAYGSNIGARNGAQAGVNMAIMAPSKQDKQRIWQNKQ